MAGGRERPSSHPSSTGAPAVGDVRSSPGCPTGVPPSNGVAQFRRDDRQCRALTAPRRIAGSFRFTVARRPSCRVGPSSIRCAEGGYRTDGTHAREHRRYWVQRDRIADGIWCAAKGLMGSTNEIFLIFQQTLNRTFGYGHRSASCGSGRRDPVPPLLLRSRALLSGPGSRPVRHSCRMATGTIRARPLMPSRPRARAFRVSMVFGVDPRRPAISLLVTP